MKTATLTHQGRSVRLYLRKGLFQGWVVYAADPFADDFTMPVIWERFTTQREALGWFLYVLRAFAKET